MQGRQAGASTAKPVSGRAAYTVCPLGKSKIVFRDSCSKWAPGRRKVECLWWCPFLDVDDKDVQDLVIGDGDGIQGGGCRR